MSIRKWENIEWSQAFFHAACEWDDETHPNVLTLPTKSMSSTSQRGYLWRCFQCVLPPFSSSEIQCREEKLPHSSRPRQRLDRCILWWLCFSVSAMVFGSSHFQFLINESERRAFHLRNVHWLYVLFTTSIIDSRIQVWETSIALRDDWFSLIVRNNVLRCRKCHGYRLWWQRTDSKWQSLN